MKPHDEGKGLWISVGVFGTAIVATVLAAPFLIGGNAVGQSLFGLLITLLTTLIAVFASRQYSKREAQGELTRYGLQAWRNLDGLAIKLSKRIESSDVGDPQLEQWLLDVDQAKWAWRDLLREVFDLQKRLELETEEVAAKFKREIGEAADPALKEQLESEQKLALAKLSAKAPLPLRVPAKTRCPSCSSDVVAQVGESAGDTAHAQCTRCGARFPVHRQADGSVFVGGQAERVKIAVACPACSEPISIAAPWGESVEFVRTCPHCQTHYRFVGSAKEQSLADLGRINAKAKCPRCASENDIWVSPNRPVRFALPCRSCGQGIQIEGTREQFRVSSTAT